MHTYYALEMTQERTIPLYSESLSEAIGTIHNLNRQYRNGRYTLVRPTEEELVGEQR